MAKFSREELHAKSAIVLTNIDENYSIMLANFSAKLLRNPKAKFFLKYHIEEMQRIFLQILMSLSG